MKKTLIFSLLMVTGSVMAVAADTVIAPAGKANIKGSSELEGLDHLIAAARTTLDAGEQLREQITNYLQLQNNYLQDPGNRDRCFKMVRAAHDILQEIECHHLTQAFDDDFLAELSLFSEMGRKRSVPRPQ